jgi:hypothetical protein
MPQVVFFSQADAKTFVAEAVASLKITLQSELNAWLDAQKLDDAECIKNIIQQALLTDGVGVGTIEHTLDNVVNAKELQLVQACYAHHKGWAVRDIDAQIEGLERYIIQLQAKVQEANGEMAPLQKEEEQQRKHGVWNVTRSAPPAASIGWGSLQMLDAPTVASLTSKVRDLKLTVEEKTAEIERLRERKDGLPAEVSSLEAIPYEFTPAFQYTVGPLQGAVRAQRTRIMDELKATSHALYIKLLEAKLKEAKPSAEVTALSGMVLNLRNFIVVSQQCAELKAERQELRQQAQAMSLMLAQCDARINDKVEQLVAARSRHHQLMISLGQIDSGLNRTQAELTSYKYSAIGFASFAIVSAVAAATMSLPVTFVVAASAVALCSLIAGLVNVYQARNLSSLIILGKNEAENLEAKMMREGKTISTHLCQSQELENVSEVAKRRVNTAGMMLEDNAQRLMSRAQQRDGFFAKAKEEGGELVRSFPCA